MSMNKQNLRLIKNYRKEALYQKQYREGLRFLLEPYGLSLIEADILFSIYYDASCDSVTNLCIDIGKTKGVVSRACDHLCKASYLRGENDLNDRRIIHFKIRTTALNLINSLSRYMESMEYVRNMQKEHDFENNRSLNEGGYLFVGRVDLKKGLFYPIHMACGDQKKLSPLPFCAYDSFLTERLIPELTEECGNMAKKKLRFSEIAKAFPEAETLKRELELDTEHANPHCIFRLEEIPEANAAALLKIYQR